MAKAREARNQVMQFKTDDIGGEICNHCGKYLFLPNGDVHKCSKGRLCYYCSGLLTEEDTRGAPEGMSVICRSCGELLQLGRKRQGVK